MKKAVFCFIFIFGLKTLFAHPHMWFTSKVEFIFSGSTLKGAYVTWTFDRFFSADIINGYDVNNDGKFSAAEAQDVYDNAFTYTRNYYYFIFIRQGKNRTSPKNVDKSKFSVRQNNGIVSYNFYINLEDVKGREVLFACYDYTFFCDITYPKNTAVKFVYDDKTIHPKYEIVENKNYPVYYDPLGAIDDFSIYNKWAPGLNTYYPLEIKVTF